MRMLQQYLPFTVLKLPLNNSININNIRWVATVLTVYGIETWGFAFGGWVRDIEVATVLTVYGIETRPRTSFKGRNKVVLQQYLPFTVLKLSKLILIL